MALLSVDCLHLFKLELRRKSGMFRRTLVLHRLFEIFAQHPARLMSRRIIQVTLLCDNYRLPLPVGSFRTNTAHAAESSNWRGIFRQVSFVLTRLLSRNNNIL